MDGARTHRKAWVNPRFPQTFTEDGIRERSRAQDGVLVDFWLPSRLLAIQITSARDLPLPYRTLRYTEAEVLRDGDRVIWEIGLVCGSVGEAWTSGVRWGGPLTAPGLTYRLEADGQPSPIACDTRHANDILRQQAMRTLQKAA